MRFERRINRLEKQVPKTDGETTQELFKRLGWDVFEEEICKTVPFLALVTNQGPGLKVWQR